MNGLRSAWQTTVRGHLEAAIQALPAAAQDRRSRVRSPRPWRNASALSHVSGFPPPVTTRRGPQTPRRQRPHRGLPQTSASRGAGSNGETSDVSASFRLDASQRRKRSLCGTSCESQGRGTSRARSSYERRRAAPNSRCSGSLSHPPFRRPRRLGRQDQLPRCRGLGRAGQELRRPPHEGISRLHRWRARLPGVGRPHDPTEAIGAARPRPDGHLRGRHRSRGRGACAPRSPPASGPSARTRAGGRGDRERGRPSILSVIYRYAQASAPAPPAPAPSPSQPVGGIGMAASATSAFMAATRSSSSRVEG